MTDLKELIAEARHMADSARHGKNTADLVALLENLADALEAAQAHDAARMNTGDLNRAKRRALVLLDRWIDTTGAVHGSYRYEVESIVEDAVEIGVQHALGDYRELESEKP